MRLPIHVVAMKSRRGLSTVEVAVVSALWGPFLLLALSAGAGMLNRSEAFEAARQAANHYARGAGVSDPGIRAALARTGSGALIFSTIRYVGRRECLDSGLEIGECANYGQFVFTHREVLGDANRCQSRYGAPDSSLTDPRTGAVRPEDAVSNAGARTGGFGLLARPAEGASVETAYVVEACVPARDPGAFGMIRESYAQAVF